MQKFHYLFDNFSIGIVVAEQLNNEKNKLEFSHKV